MRDEDGAGAEDAARDEAPAIRGTALRVARGNKTVLRGIDMCARGGEVLGVLGPSGAG